MFPNSHIVIPFYLFYSIFSTYPVLINKSKYLHGFNNLKTLFYNSFLYVFILLSFLKNVLLYAIVGHGEVQKLLFNYCINLNLIIQTYILLNPLLWITIICLSCAGILIPTQDHPFCLKIYQFVIGI